MRIVHRFSREDQRWFALASGDANPLHMDADWASRVFPGEQVVHGLHAAIWALDEVMRAGNRLAGVRARFLKPIVVDDEVELGTRADAVRLLVRGETMVVLHLHATAALDAFWAAPAAHAVTASPRDRSREDVLGLVDSIRLPDGAALLGARFPALAAAIGAQALAGLAGISTIVGMECPGLHSMLSEFSAAFCADAPEPDLTFQVRKHHTVFSRVEMQFRGYGLIGTVAAFSGRPDADPIADQDVRALVRPDEFAGQRPLIIGASSGLGAVSARLLAAGGAEPILTFRGSAASLDPVIAAVAALGGRCDVLPFDVGDTAKGAANLAAAGWRGAELYYFASPRIFRRRIEPYQARDLRDFLAVYVDGFYETVRALVDSRGGAPLRVFYPSSTAIVENVPELFEYKLAKSAGEQLCVRLQEKYKTLSIVSIRLPRIATRQTKTSMQVEAETPEQVMLPILRQMQNPGAD